MYSAQTRTQRGQANTCALEDPPNAYTAFCFVQDSEAARAKCEIPVRRYCRQRIPPRKTRQM